LNRTLSGTEKARESGLTSSGGLALPSPSLSAPTSTLPNSDCCALSLQPFQNAVAVITEASERNPTARADVFELMNIVPYIRKYKTNPVTGEPLDTSQLIKLNFFKVSALGWSVGRESC
jgi:hypothetical protein